MRGGKGWENSMVQKYVLETEGYRICFALQETQAAKESAEVVVELILDRNLGDVAVQSVPTLMTVRDLSRLVAYFEAHIARLQQHPDSESDVFVPLELGFQVQALAGEVQAGDDGEFSVRFFVNVGESSTSRSSRLYWWRISRDPQKSPGVSRLTARGFSGLVSCARREPCIGGMARKRVLCLFLVHFSARDAW